jgi:DNA-binding NtrC family response regulator
MPQRSQTVLIADDDAAIRTVLNQALTRAGYSVRVTSNATSLWRWVSEGEGDLVITDVVMPDENAFDLLPRMKKARPDLPIIVMSAQNTFMTAVRASEKGAYDYLPKPFDLKELIAIVGRAMAEPKRKAIGAPTVEEGAENMPLVGRSAAMQEIYRVLARLMQTDLTVTISGESGTGKELWPARCTSSGAGPKGPFVAINMAAIPRDLSKRNCLAMRRARSPAHSPGWSVASSRLKAARFFSMRLAICRWTRRPGFCVCSSKASTRPSGDALRFVLMCASWRQQTRICAN